MPPPASSRISKMMSRMVIMEELLVGGQDDRGVASMPTPGRVQSRLDSIA
jgi:hypothetical protein